MRVVFSFDEDYLAIFVADSLIYFLRLARVYKFIIFRGKQ